MTDEVKLLPCPFCGHQPLVGIVSVGCRNPFCRIRPQSNVHETLNETVKEWNTRAPAPREYGWRRVETLPRGTTLFLAYDSGVVSKSPGVKVWRAIDSDVRQFYHAGITHWRPLPSPPAGKEWE